MNKSLLIKPNIISISGNDNAYNSYVGKETIGKFFCKNKFDVHLLKISDELKFGYFMSDRQSIIDSVKNNQTVKYYDSIWNDGLWTVMCKVFKKIYPVTSILRYFNILFSKSISLISYCIPLRFDFEKYNFKKISINDTNPNGINNLIQNSINDVELVFDSLFCNNLCEINSLLLKYNSREKNKNYFIQSELLYIKILNILNNSYDKNKVVFIIDDIKSNNDLKFIRRIGGKLMRFDVLENFSIGEEYLNSLVHNQCHYDYKSSCKLEDNEVAGIMKTFFYENQCVKDIYNKERENNKKQCDACIINKIIVPEIINEMIEKEIKSEISSDDDREYLKIESNDKEINTSNILKPQQENKEQDNIAKKMFDKVGNLVNWNN